MTPCCGEMACDSCVRAGLLAPPGMRCPLCKHDRVQLDALVPAASIRRQVNAFLVEQRDLAAKKAAEEAAQVAREAEAAAAEAARREAEDAKAAEEAAAAAAAQPPPLEREMSTDSVDEFGEAAYSVKKPL